MEKEKKLKTTDKIREAFFQVQMLENLLPKILKISWLGRKRPVDEVVKYINQIASAKSYLWKEVYNVYPEILGKNASVNIHEISYFSEK